MGIVIIVVFALLIGGGGTGYTINQGRILAVESSIADRRELLNDSVNIDNIQTRRFPDLVLARLLGFGRHESLEVPERTRGDVKIDFA